MVMELPPVIVRLIKLIPLIRMRFFMRMRILIWLIGILFVTITPIRNGQSIRLLGLLLGVLVILDRNIFLFIQVPPLPLNSLIRE